MNERMVNYKCENCGAIGELDEYYDFLQCPQCQGKMLPLNSLDELMSSDFVPPNLDDDATISISREFIPKSHKGVKVAAAVDIGFGGMLSSSITGKYSPLTSSQDKTEQTRFAPPPPPKPAPTHHTPTYQASTTTKNRPATTTRNKPVSKSKKSFTIHKKKKQGKKHTGSFSPASTSSSRPVTKTSLRIKPVKKKVLRSSHKQTNNYPTMVAEDEINTSPSGMEQTQNELQIPKEIYNTPLPQEENTSSAINVTDNSNIESTEQIEESTPNNQEIQLNIESIVNDINSGKISKDPNDINENNISEEEKPQKAKPKIATAVGIEPQKKQEEVDSQKNVKEKEDAAPIKNRKEKQQASPEQKSSQAKTVAKNNKQKNVAPNPNKKSTLPPPKRKKTNANKQTKPQSGQQTKQGKPQQQKSKQNTNKQNNKKSENKQNTKKPQAARKNPKAPVKNNTNNKKPASNTQQGQQQNPNSNENNANEAHPQMTRTGLIRLQMAKKKQIKVILGVIIGVIALLVFIVTKACMSAMTPAKRTPKKQRINANSAVGKYYAKNSGSSSYSSGSSSSRPTVERSDLYKDFMDLKRKTKKMPQGSADQIDEIINVWEQFIDDHASESSDAKYDEATQYIENLKESKKMYTEGFGL